jgi:hypothetical protein
MTPSPPCRPACPEELRKKLLPDALLAMCHMAATPLGRSCLAAARCLPRWLSRVRSLAPKELQLLVMVLVSCLADWTATVYFVPLMRPGAETWVRGYMDTQDWTSSAYQETCPPLLVQQVSRQLLNHEQQQQQQQHPRFTCSR